jgi:hypothetical protein
MISAGAIAGASCFTPCYLCEKPRKEFWDHATPSRTRTIQNTLEAAHLPHKDTCFPYTCFHCAKVFASAQEMTEEKLKETKTKAHETKHHQKHAGVHHHKRPLWEFVAIIMRVFDLLHWLLRGAETIWTLLVKPHIVETLQQETIMAYLKEHIHAYIKTKAAKVAKKDGVKKVKDPSFIGREARLYVQHAVAVLKLVFDDITSDDFLLGEAFIVAFRAFYEEVKTRMPKDTPQEREAKAATVNRLGKDLVDKLVACTTREDVNLYFHLGADHAGDMIILHGDLIDYSIDQLEAVHAKRKLLARRLSNKRVGTLKSRLYQTHKCEWVAKLINTNVAGRTTSRYLLEQKARARKAQALLDANLE